MVLTALPFANALKVEGDVRKSVTTYDPYDDSVPTDECSRVLNRPVESYVTRVNQI